MKLLQLFRTPTAAFAREPLGESPAAPDHAPRVSAARAERAEAHRTAGDRADLELSAVSGIRSAESLERIEVLLGAILAALSKPAA